MTSIRERLQKSNQTQNEIASQLGITQSRVSNLIRYRLQDFSLDTLVDLSYKLGVNVEMVLSEKSPASAAVETPV